MSAITVNGDLVHYEVLGRGRPVVLLHSWLGSWRYWIPTMQQLSVKYRIYALDLWGFGDSGKNRQYYSIDGQAELLERFLDRMGIPKAVFIGHGLGGAVVAHFATRPNCGQIVHRMMSVSTPVFGSGYRASTSIEAKKTEPPKQLERSTASTPAAPPAFTVQTSADSDTIQSISSEDRNRLAAAAAAQAAQANANRGNSDTTPSGNPFAAIIGRTKPQMLLSRNMDTSSSDFEKLKAEVDKADEEAIKTSAESLSQYNPLRNLLKTASPTLTIYGENDTLVPPPGEDIAMSLSSHPQIKLLVLDNLRHYPMLEDTSRFIRLLKEFLEAPDLQQLQMKDEWKRRMR